MTFRLTWATAVGVLLIIAPAAASAQGFRPERPFRGLFGSGLDSTEHSLVAHAALGTGWDSNLVADARGNLQPTLSDFNQTFEGGVTQFSGGLTYSLNKQWMSIGAAAATSARYYPSLSNDILRRDNVSISGRVSIFRGLDANVFASYQPFSLTSVFPLATDPIPGEVAAPDFELASSLEHFIQYGGGLSYERQLSRRTSFDASYTHRARTSSARVPVFSSDSAGFRVNHKLTRDLGMRVGYRYSVGNYRDTRRNGHLIDAGIDYRKSLSFSRRTTLSFGTGTTATSRPEGADNRTVFRATGNVRLNHEIGRSWNASTAYSRGLHFSESWQEPVFADSLSASLQGLLSRRLQFQASARGSTGRTAFDDLGGGGFDVFSAGTGLAFAVSRYVNVGCNYSFYRHQFGERFELAPGFPGEMDRHSVRAQVSVWAPLFQSRRANASR